MYSTDPQSMSVLRHMLNALVPSFPFLPMLREDTPMSEQLAKPLALLQQEFKLPITGRLDLQTLHLIRSLYLETEQLHTQVRPLRVIPAEGYQARPGTQQNFMILPQTMFLVLAQYFTGLTSGIPDGHHRGHSVDNVRWLQRASGLDPTGVLDAAVWGLLSRLYEVMVVWCPDPHCSSRFRGGQG